MQTGEASVVAVGSPVGSPVRILAGQVQFRHDLRDHDLFSKNGRGIKAVAVALTQVASATGLVPLDAKANQYAPSPRFKNGAGRCQTP